MKNKLYTLLLFFGLVVNSFGGVKYPMVLFEKDLSISTWDKAKDQHTASLWQPLVYLFEKGSAVKISYDRDSFSVASEERLSSV